LGFCNGWDCGYVFFELLVVSYPPPSFRLPPPKGDSLLELFVAILRAFVPPKGDKNTLAQSSPPSPTVTPPPREDREQGQKTLHPSRGELAQPTSA